MSAGMRPRWIVSPAYDLGWFVLPGLIALVVGVAVGLGLPPSEGESLGLWIVGVVLVDVAHVWASLYRTYLDPEARRLHANLLRAAPVLAFVLAFVAHAVSPALFWTVLAYVAVFHFIKQQEGFALLYLRAEALSRRRASSDSGDDSGDGAKLDRRLTRAAIWAGTAAPVLWWHAHLPRRFAWFMDGDFIPGAPELVGQLALGVEALVLAAFALRRVQLRVRGEGAHPMVDALVALTAASWTLGIVAFDDDRVFTLTNVFLHGVPYFALVWVAGGRERVEAGLGRARAPLVLALAFYGLLAILAVTEETLWDRLVWHDHESLFGVGGLELGELGMALVVAALTLPQATHYVLDRYIWRSGPDSNNPRLAAQLNLESRP